MKHTPEKDTPAVFVHTGQGQVIVAACVAQARAAGCKRIFVLSDRLGPWRFIPGVIPFAFSNAEQYGALEFRKVFANYSSYPGGYAEVIFEKFFALLALFEKYSLERILYLDSDLLLFKSATELAEIHPCDFSGASAPEDNHESISPHCMFLTQKVCARVCSDLLATYGSKEGHEKLKALWEHKKEMNPAWGVGEMDFLAFIRDSGDFHYVKLNEGNPRVDMSIQFAEGFVCENGIKRISFDHGKPYGVLEKTGERVYFHAVHLQGYFKHLVIHYAQLNWFYKKLLYALWKLETQGLLKWPKMPEPHAASRA